MGFQEFDHGLVPLRESQIQWTLLISGPCVDIGAGFHEQVRERQVTGLGSGVKRRPSTVLLSIDVGSMVDQELTNLRSAAGCGKIGRAHV